MDNDMEKKTKTRLRIIRLTFASFVVIAFLIFMWKIIPLMKGLSTEEGQIEFKNQINKLGFKGSLLVFGIQILQILLVILPGEPFEILAGMCYGTWGGYLFITISILITTPIIFFLVRKLGHKYLYNFFEEERINKVMNNKLLKNPRNLDIILFILFFLPASPKCLFVYIGGLLPIKPSRFILISTFARFPSIITSTMAGAHITKGNWEISVLIYLLSFVVAAFILCILKIKDKNKEIMDIIK